MNSARRIGLGTTFLFLARAIIAALLLTGALRAPGTAFATFHDTGRWRDTVTVQPQGVSVIHMTVMRGPGDSTRVVYWGDDPASAYLARFGNWPDTSFDYMAVPNYVTEMFCAGHSALDDGTLLVSGGTKILAGTTGLNHSNIFDLSKINFSQAVDPSNPQNRGWVRQRNMAYPRWYPTNTTLSDGRVLVTTGNQFHYATSIGGLVSGSQSNQVKTAAQHDTTIVASQTPSGTAPGAREGHSGSYDPRAQRTLVFGGYTGSVYKNDVWSLARSYGANNDAESWTWQQITPQGTAPGIRSQHGASFSPLDTSLVVFGGWNGSAPLGDTWRLYLNRPTGVGSWVNQTGGTAPSARYGHSAILNSPQDQSPQDKVIIFGGRNATTFYQDVWAFTLATSSWSQLSTTGGPPPAREGHAVVVYSAIDTLRMLVYGGRDASGNYLNDVWELKLRTLSSPTPLGLWVQLSPAADPNYGTPTKRSRHAAVFPAEGLFGMLIQGGENADGQLGGMWRLDVGFAGSGSTLHPTFAWDSVRTTASGTTPPQSRQAMSDDVENAFAIVPERFAKGTPTGGWEVLDAMPKKLENYPFMFLLPDGKLFYAGTSDGADRNTLLLDLNTGWDPTVRVSPTAGTSAVMYRPGRIMKCGASGNVVAPTDSCSLGLSGAAGVWGSADLMPNPQNGGEGPGRIRHNLTLLPNGQVLATGGRMTVELDSPPRKRPWIWDPVTGIWRTDIVLATDPAARGYHSTAALLPDGRILSAGGFAVGSEPNNTYRATIFWPPYLFNGDQLATRPVIQSASSTVGYNDTILVTTPQGSSIASACLIKPSSVTHAFNSDQRYVPLTILGGSCNSAQCLALASPANPNLAPPGDYMLFINDNAGVPSVAKWVRVGCTSGDCAAPSAVTDLSVSVGRKSIAASWTAPGDDGNCGTAVAYDLRYSTTIITEASFSSATQIDPTLYNSPDCASTPECVTKDNFTCGSYYFALKTRDEVSNWSPLSNVAYASVPCTGNHFAECGAGGLMAQGGGDSGWTPENSLFPAGSMASDTYGLKATLTPLGGAYRVLLAKGGTSRADLDQVSLAMAVYDDSLRAFLNGDHLSMGKRRPAMLAVNATGVDLTSQLGGSSALPYFGTPGDVLTVTLAATGSTGLLSLIDAAGNRAGADPDSTGLLVQVPDGSGWRTVAHHYPRRRYDEFIADPAGSNLVRIVFLGNHEIRFVGSVVERETRTPAALEMSAAWHSRLGDVTEAVSSSGGGQTTLLPGDALLLSYLTPAASQGRIAQVLQVKGRYSTLAPTRAQRVPGPKPDEHWVTELKRSVPNPASGSVKLGFEMAAPGEISVEVFDIAGRLVHTVAEGRMAAGPYERVWDLRDRGGVKVPPALYFVRMRTGSWHKEQRVVLFGR